MMNFIAEHYPLKKYGTIALFFVFSLVALYYFIGFRPFTETDKILTYFCELSTNEGIDFIDLSVSIPVFVVNENEFSVFITNTTSEDLENININFVPVVRTNRGFASVKFESITIDRIKTDTNESTTGKLTINGMKDGDYIEIRDIFIVLADKNSSCTKTRYSYNDFVTYNQLGSLALSLVNNIPIATLTLFILSALSCLFFEDENQDFHPTSRLGVYYIERVFFRASIPLSLFFIVLHWVTSVLLDIWNNNYLSFVLFLIIYIAVSLTVIKRLTTLIKIKPKTKIIINSSGKEKEVELLE